MKKSEKAVQHWLGQYTAQHNITYITQVLQRFEDKVFNGLQVSPKCLH